MSTGNTSGISSAQLLAMIQGMFDTELKRRQLDEYTLPKYREIELPTSYANLTGFTPGDFRGPYAGMPTFGGLSGMGELMGELGSNLDPRLAAMGYTAGQSTLGGRALNLQGDAQRAAEQNAALNRQLQGDIQRFSERDTEQKRLQSINEFDQKMSLETGQAFIGGQPAPAWLAPHAEWARQWAGTHSGNLPTYEDLGQALSKYGQRVEDYNPAGAGKPFPGTPAAAQTQGMQMEMGGDRSFQTMARPDGVSGQIGGTGTGTAVSRNAAGDATASNFGTGPKSQSQRGLEESGRQFDTSTALQAEIQRRTLDLQAARDAAEIARTNGQTAIADSQEARADEIERGMFGLQQQKFAEEQRQFNESLGFQKGVATGSVDGRDTVEAGGLMGVFNGRSTLPGQVAYGGDALVNSGITSETQRMLGYVPGQGQTLEAQALRGFTPQGATLQREGQEADIALRALQQESQLRTDPFALERYRRGVSGSGIANSIEAVAGRRQLPTVGGPTFGAQAPSMGQQIQSMTGPTFGQPMASANAQLQALPQLHQMNAREYGKLDPSGRRFVNSAFKQAGMAADDDDIQNAYSKALPAFARKGVPTFGRMAA